MYISVFNARSTTENKPFNGVTDQALRTTPVSKYLIIYNVRVSFVTEVIVTTVEVNKPSPVNHWLTEQDLDRVQKLQGKDSDLPLLA